MFRKPRRIEAGTIYHVLNRGNGRRMLFNKDADFAAFLKLLSEAVERFEVDLLSPRQRRRRDQGAHRS